MKKIILSIAFVTALASCGSQNTVLKSGNYNLESNCPTQGTCLFEVLKDSSLVYKQNGAGKLYYESQAQEGKSILKYTYTKTPNQQAQDDFYREEVIIETTSDVASLNRDSEIKMLFGVFCYCKDIAGYREVKDGYAEYKDGKVIITLPDVIQNQKTKTIIADIK
ncbi:hypothetical protein FUA48_02770 [Flavobacterium alkalisoli]|uniref:Lipoprotein n=1 Tax=Flavobacterium alkalisoli TaxID=2602769 RepID=A0A5B9FNM6_9FLAO|nr:hypothetical protein [Flavobacterium alkalisoli]QEE48530.1 hypothetical protein FUA48_02770 [Flavobacterium alkalisoli]